MKTFLNILGIIAIAAVASFLCMLPKLILEDNSNNAVSITSKPIEAIVVYDGTSKPIEYITAEYGNNKIKLTDKEVINTYKGNVGSTIRLVLITWTYEDGRIEEKLVFNKNVYNGGDIK